MHIPTLHWPAQRTESPPSCWTTVALRACGDQLRSAPQRLQLNSVVFSSDVLTARHPLDDPKAAGLQFGTRTVKEWTFAAANVLIFCPREVRAADKASFRRLQFARTFAELGVQAAGL